MNTFPIHCVRIAVQCQDSLWIVGHSDNQTSKKVVCTVNYTCCIAENCVSIIVQYSISQSSKVIGQHSNMVLLTCKCSWLKCTVERVDPCMSILVFVCMGVKIFFSTFWGTDRAFFKAAHCTGVDPFGTSHGCFRKLMWIHTKITAYMLVFSTPNKIVSWKSCSVQLPERQLLQIHQAL